MLFQKLQSESRVRGEVARKLICGGELRYVKNHDSLTTRKFTLVELLVVIAIIAVLAAMLLPALNQARERAKSTKCISNLKNCALGLQSYADDSAEFFPASLSLIGTKSYGWAGIMVYYNYLPGGPYLSYDTILLCPSAQYGEASTHAWTPSGNRSYGLARGIADIGELSNYTADLSYYHIHRLKIIRPEFQRVPLGGDSISTRDLTQSSILVMRDPSNSVRGVDTSKDRTLHTRHGGLANVFYPDGHVASLRKADVTSDTWMTYAAAPSNGIF